MRSLGPVGGMLGWALADAEIMRNAMRFGRTDLGHDGIFVADFVVWARVVIEDFGNRDVRFGANVIKCGNLWRG